MLRIGFINLIIISKMPPSYLKKNCLPSLDLLIGFILIRQKRRRQISKSFKNGLDLIFKIHVLVSLSLNLLIFLKIQYFNYLFSPYNLTVTILVMLLVRKRLAYLKEKLINNNIYFVQVIKVIFCNLLKLLPIFIQHI